MSVGSSDTGGNQIFLKIILNIKNFEYFVEKTSIWKNRWKKWCLWHCNVVQYIFWQSFSDLIVFIISHYNCGHFRLIFLKIDNFGLLSTRRDVCKKGNSSYTVLQLMDAIDYILKI